MLPIRRYDGSYHKNPNINEKISTMEIAEGIGPAIIPPEPLEECPFEHEKPKNPNIKNELGGIGTTLGGNMRDGIGIHKVSPPFGPDYSVVKKTDPDPRDADKLTSITIKIDGETRKLNGKELPYPLTCAAHHLIPAQESLKVYPRILRFMCKDEDPQDFRKSGKPAPANVEGGTDVNGIQNGVWLPGNYAVGGGKKGIGTWANKASDERNHDANDNWENTCSDDWITNSDPEEEEGPQSLVEALANASREEYMLPGKNFHINNGNPKWGYVKAAMDATGGQFHDRHGPYSTKVIQYLKKIAEVYEIMYIRSKRDYPCEKCKIATKPDGVTKDTLVGPPYGIVSRLLIGSDFFKRLVKTQLISVENIFTSDWVRCWIEKKIGRKVKM
jgi:hypothetical protein